MDLDAYQLEAGRTATRDMDAYPEVVRQAAACLDNAGRDGEELLKLQDVHTWGHGLAGEAGEVCDLLKKVHGHGKPYDAGKLKKELGDVLWYVANLANIHGFTLSEVAQANVDKLRARHPSGFTVASAAAKADEKCDVPHPVWPHIHCERAGKHAGEPHIRNYPRSSGITEPVTWEKDSPAPKLVERVTFGPVVNVDANGSPVSEDDLDGDVLG